MSIQETLSPTPELPGPTGEELVALLDHLPGLVAYWDTDLRNRFCNAISEKWFGLSRGELLTSLTERQE